MFVPDHSGGPVPFWGSLLSFKKSTWTISKYLEKMGMEVKKKIITPSQPYFVRHDPYLSRCPKISLGQFAWHSGCKTLLSNSPLRSDPNFFEGFDLVFEDFYLVGAYHPIFVGISGWRMKREVKINKKSNFADTQQVKAARCKLLFFWESADATVI